MGCETRKWQQVDDLVPFDGDEYWTGWFASDCLRQSLPITILVVVCWAFFSLADLLLGCSLQHCIVIWRIIFDSFALVCIWEFMENEIWQRRLRRRVQKWLGMPLLNCNALIRVEFCKHLSRWSVFRQNNEFLPAAVMLLSNRACNYRGRTLNSPVVINTQWPLY